MSKTKRVLIAPNLTPYTYFEGEDRFRSILPVEWFDQIPRLYAFSNDKRSWEILGEELTAYKALNAIMKVKGYSGFYFPPKSAEMDHRVYFVRRGAIPDVCVWWLAICEV